MSEDRNNLNGGSELLFDRVVSILEQARGNVVRSVNTNMVQAYWLIGREIVEEIQSGEERAEYGRQILENLSKRLTERYGKGFSVPNLQNFRKFYLTFPDRLEAESRIQYPTGTKFSKGEPIQYPAGRKLDKETKLSLPGGESKAIEKRHLSGGELQRGFSPDLSWSHYRALMRVDDRAARDFYEREAIACGWDKRTLERQIHSYYYERTLKSRDPDKMLAEGRDLPVPAGAAFDELKHPYVLEFLGLPNAAVLRESDLEGAIITHLQWFMLELGTGFAFVARQKHIHVDDDDRFIDLIFYHY